MDHNAYKISACFYLSVTTFVYIPVCIFNCPSLQRYVPFLFCNLECIMLFILIDLCVTPSYCLHPESP